MALTEDNGILTTALRLENTDDCLSMVSFGVILDLSHLL